MDNSSKLRRFQQSTSVSPRLLRSRSTSTTPVSRSLLPDPHTLTSGFRTSKTEQKQPKASSRKTWKKMEEAVVPTTIDGGFVRFIPNNENRNIEVKRPTRSASTSPSAWALSPGRSMPCSPAKVEAAPPLPKSPTSFCKLIKGEGEGGGVSGVLKYFRQKKVSPVMEEEYHRFRMAYNGLLQWRFANARGEASMAGMKRVAQKRLFNGWARISLTRNFIAEKRGKIQRLKHEIKLYRTLPSQMKLLNEWSSTLEHKNVEAVGRVVRKLSAISHCLPLVHNAQGDIISTKDAMLSATKVMNNIHNMIFDMQQPVETTCFLLTELSIMLKQQKQFFRELDKSMTTVASLEAHEKNLIVHQLQLVKQVKENKTPLEQKDPDLETELA